MFAAVSSPPWSRRTEVAVTAAFWLLLTMLLLIRRALLPSGFVALTSAAVVGTVLEYAFWIALTPAVFWLVRTFPLQRGAVVQRLIVHIGIGLVVAALVELTRTALLLGLVDVGWIESLPRRAFSGGGRRTREITAWMSVSRFQFLDEFVIYTGVLAAGVARMSFLRALDRESEAGRLEAERARLETQLADARLQALRMQLNPHFLFNALNAVSAFIERDPERAQTMIAQLAGLMRRVLDGDARLEIPLADERALLRDYFAIQQARFGDALTVDLDFAPDTLDAHLPPLLLQPLAENAVEHGVSKLVDVAGRVTVTAVREQSEGRDRLVLTVSDNGPGVEQHASTVGVGLANTRNRLAALYGDAASFALESSESGGTRATVTLPFRTTPTHR